MKRQPSKSTAIPSEQEFDTMLAETSPTLFDGASTQNALLERMLVTRRLLASLPPTRSRSYIVQLHKTDLSRPLEMRPVGKGLTIGRTNSSEWCVVDGPAKLSSRHFMVRRQANRYLLKDLDSRNGTCVNEDPRPVQDCALCSGDFIHAGGCTFLFIVSESADLTSCPGLPKQQRIAMNERPRL